MNKFVIIPEKEEDNIFKLLSLLWAINEEYEDSQISIVHSVDLRDQLSTFPIKVQFFQVDEKDYGAMASIKLAAKLSDLFNISHALIYRQEVGVLQFAKSLKAKVRLGWKSLVNDVFLTEGIEKNNTSTYLSLWRSSKTINSTIEVPTDLVNREEAKLPENFFKNSSQTPFLFISCDSFSDEPIILNLSRELAEAIKDHRLIIWSRKDSEILKEMEQVNENVVNASEAAEAQIHYYLTRCLSHISSIEWHAHLSNYFGCEPYLLSKKKPYSINGLKYAPHWIEIEGEDSLYYQDAGERNSLTLDELANIILRENEI